jgi:hypothetical protein
MKKQQKSKQSQTDCKMVTQQSRCTNKESSSRSYSSVVSGNGEITEGMSFTIHSNDDACSSRTNLSNNQISEMNKMIHGMHKIMTETCTD